MLQYYGLGTAFFSHIVQSWVKYLFRLHIKASMPTKNKSVSSAWAHTWQLLWHIKAIVEAPHGLLRTRLHVSTQYQTTHWQQHVQFAKVWSAGPTSVSTQPNTQWISSVQTIQKAPEEHAIHNQRGTSASYHVEASDTWCFFFVCIFVVYSE